MVDDSGQLDLVGKTAVRLTLQVEQELAHRCRSRHDALVQCFNASMLDPKQVYGPVGISQTQFSKILTGAQFPDPDISFKWMAACGNLIPFRYDAFKLHHTVAPIQTGLEAKVKELQDELAQERLVNTRLAQMLRGA